MNGSRLFVCLPPSSAAAQALDGTNKNLAQSPHPAPPPPPFLEIHRKKPGCCARAGLQIEADELIHKKTQHKSKQVSFTHL